jgi:vitamin B12 transporter
MSLRLGICFLMIAAVPEVFGQQDPVLLKSVTIYGLTDSLFLTGSTVESLDARLKLQQNSQHLGEILSFQFPIYFRNYGSGMISGISMRGTSPQHVAVRWNGININSFSLGQADFSLLPAAAFDDIKVHQGGGSARFGSGAIGGTILLNSAHDQSDVLAVTQEAGSFGRYFTSVRGNYKIRKVSFSTSAYNLATENNFRIPNSDDRQKNAAYNQFGVVQGLQYTFNSKHRISADYWYHQADRQIQPPLGNLNSKDEQKDQSHRLSLRYQLDSGWGQTDVIGGFVDDVIVFNGARSEITRWIASASHQKVFNNEWNLNVTSEWNHIIGKVPEYGNIDPTEDRIDLGVSIKKVFGRVTGTLNLRKPFITSLDPPLLPYLGVSIDMLRRVDYTLVFNANASRNFRAPTFNDRYWADLGRRDLQSETSYGGESGFHLNIRKIFTVAGTSGSNGCRMKLAYSDREILGRSRQRVPRFPWK